MSTNTTVISAISINVNGANYYSGSEEEISSPRIEELKSNKKSHKSKTSNGSNNSNHSNGSTSPQQTTEGDLRTCFASKIRTTAQEAFATLEITQESIDMLSSFLQDTLVWVVMESGNISNAENSNWISSRHIHLALRKLLVGETSRGGSLGSDELMALTKQKDPDSPRPIATPVLNSLLRASSSASDDSHAAYTVDNILSQSQSLKHEKITDYFKEVDNATSSFLEMANGDGEGDDGEGEWIKTGMKEDVYTSKKDSCLRGVAEIDKPAKVVFEYLKDFSKRKKWDTLIQEAKVIEDIDKYTQIVHTTYGYGGCLLRTQRDFCIISHWFSQADGSYVHVAQSTTHDQCPIVNGILRATIHHSGYIVCPKTDTSCVVTHCMNIDLNDTPTPVAAIIHQKQLLMLSRLRFQLTGSRLCVKQK